MPILLTSLNQYPTLLAHSANLLEGLYVLLMFFLYFFLFFNARLSRPGSSETNGQSSPKFRDW